MEQIQQYSFQANNIYYKHQKPQKLHKSIYDPNLPPSYSTFGTKTTSKLLNNCNGNLNMIYRDANCKCNHQLGSEPKQIKDKLHCEKNKHANFGKPNGQYKEKPVTHFYN
ncbi:hypothetical protein PPERSA_10126 [Pseudocohnilembus persalinus]|uniref:Uncharacterized protein n=1 Tax=Pseudocohnilembus persalinus TaxID=266149 RepID=A0A0V0QZY3_PSEPJ|nr:hypothetical protein PPERSA_10126 [Pseudocohnilembus persalinus]|eukprot:KRX07842.1 hypothetical protein PPERSA_10126 [Pseudocohnilembus persalinus]